MMIKKESALKVPTLEILNLNKYYKNFRLNNVSFLVNKNSICGFIGINGAGKTTTIRTMLGLSKPDSGVINIFGKKFTGIEKEIKENIGVVFDSSAFYEELSIKEMKYIISKAYKNWNDETFHNYLERFKLDISKEIVDLSKGMKMKLSLAYALSHNPQLLIMDEPTSGLDPLIRKQVLDILLEYKSLGENSVFFSTHITSDLDKVADQLIMIHNGEIIFSMSKEQLLERAQGKSIEDFMLKFIESENGEREI